jgi:hypothetical protein
LSASTARPTNTRGSPTLAEEPVTAQAGLRRLQRLQARPTPPAITPRVRACRDADGGLTVGLRVGKCQRGASGARATGVHLRCRAREQGPQRTNASSEPSRPAPPSPGFTTHDAAVLGHEAAPGGGGFLGRVHRRGAVPVNQPAVVDHDATVDQHGLHVTRVGVADEVLHRIEGRREPEGPVVEHRQVGALTGLDRPDLRSGPSAPAPTDTTSSALRTCWTWRWWTRQELNLRPPARQATNHSAEVCGISAVRFRFEASLCSKPCPMAPESRAGRAPDSRPAARRLRAASPPRQSRTAGRWPGSGDR